MYGKIGSQIQTLNRDICIYWTDKFACHDFNEFSQCKVDKDSRIHSSEIHAVESFALCNDSKTPGYGLATYTSNPLSLTSFYNSLAL